MSIEDLKKARIITALVTPFKEDGSINFEALSKLIEHLLAHHTEGLIIAGTTGESPTLTHEEELELFELVQMILEIQLNSCVKLTNLVVLLPDLQ